MAMTFRVRRIQVAIIVAVFGLSIPAFAGEAAANHGLPNDALMCGTVITANTTLQHSVGPCVDNGLVIGSDGVTLDLNGHTVYGLPGLPQAGGPLGGAGILVDGRQDVTVTNGTVKDFDGGVVIRGGEDNTVSDVHVTDNVGGPLSQWGEGIGVWSSTGNTLQGNTVSGNGPYAGIGLYGAGDNTVSGNTVTTNDVDRTPTVNEDIGIRIEPGSHNNSVSGNTVTSNGLDGVAVWGTDNSITNNTINNNGFHNKTHRPGDGVRIWASASNTTVTNNTICGNAGSPVVALSSGNTINSNTTTCS